MAFALPSPTVNSLEDAQHDFDALSAYLATLLPSGVVAPYAGSSAPKGWLLCDGSTYNRGDYPDLSKALGGSGTTFTLPDMRSRSVVGAGAGAGLSNRTLLATGGEENHTLSTSEMPSHSHGVTDPGHVHTTSGGAQYVVDFGPNTVGGTPGIPFNQTGMLPAVTNISIQAAGGGTGHNNMHPWVALNYIIKT